MFYRNIVMKMLECKKRKFDDVTLQYSMGVNTFPPGVYKSHT